MNRKWRIPLILAASFVACASSASSRLVASDSASIAPSHVDLLLMVERPVFVRLHILRDGANQRAGWSARIEESFESYDEDGDGKLSARELVTIAWLAPQVEELDSKGLRRFLRTHRIRRLASDEPVTRDEFRQLAERLQPPFAVNNIRTTGQVAVLFDFLDNDDDERIEIPGDPHFVMASLAAIDFDDDELVSFEELTAIRPNGRNQLATPRPLAVDRGTMAWRGTSGRNQFIDLTGVQSLREVAMMFYSNYMQEVARVKQAADADSSAIPGAIKYLLTNEMSGLSEDAFAHADTDGNASLDEDEIEAYLASPFPDVEIDVYMGEQPKAIAAEDIRLRPGASDDGFVRVVANESSRVRLFIGSNEYEFGVAGTNSTVDTSIYEQQFQASDRDNNQYLDPDEAQRTGVFRQVFKSMDADGDEKLFVEEMTSWITNAYADATARTQMSVALRGQALFSALDRDANQRLTRRELTDAVPTLTELDRDGDGAVTTGELPRRFFLQFGPAEPTGLPIRQAFALNQGIRTAQPSRSQREQSPAWFRQMDRNGDGDLSEREFLAPLQYFESLDSNGDGLIDPSEASAAAEL